MKDPLEPIDPEVKIRRMSRRSFLWGAMAVAAGYSAFRYLGDRTPIDGLSWPFRRALETNQAIAQDYFSYTSLAKTFPDSEARMPIDNGDEGLSDGFDPETWKLSVIGTGLDADPQLTLSEIKALGKIEMTTELRCIEGWSVVVHWTGCKFSDLLRKYPPAANGDQPVNADQLSTLPNYVAMETPDGGYYVGLDMASAMHPQTLLCWAMNDQPLALEHGAPLRLVIPTKYGIKNIKRIGKVTYTNARPKDFWAEQGYDWYAGL